MNSDHDKSFCKFHCTNNNRNLSGNIVQGGKSFVLNVLISYVITINGNIISVQEVLVYYVLLIISSIGTKVLNMLVNVISIFVI